MKKTVLLFIISLVNIHSYQVKMDGMYFSFIENETLEENTISIIQSSTDLIEWESVACRIGISNWAKLKRCSLDQQIYSQFIDNAKPDLAFYRIITECTGVELSSENKAKIVAESLSYEMRDPVLSIIGYDQLWTIVIQAGEDQYIASGWSLEIAYYDALRIFYEL